jgi:benzoyl-CoA reductase/2-hydroxyglutaryl-CoA dehydratase subunit BcrC/BadD/HgdB
MRPSDMTNPDPTMKLRNGAGSIERLTWHYENPAAESVALAADSFPVVGVTSNTAPWELIRAAGAFPCVINPGNENHADICNFMEEGVFEQRIRAIFGAAISGKLQYLSLLVIPRTSEQEYKLYLYLREVARLDPGRRIPPVYLYDMLHTRSPETYAYGLERTRRFRQKLEDLTGSPIHDTALRYAIEESNLARKVIRTLLSLRGHEPRMAGTEALALISASYFISRDAYVHHAENAAEIISSRCALAGKRLMISGASLHHRGLHQALEKHGAVVVAENDWWGSRSAGGDIDVGSRDLLTAVFEKYYLDAPSPRVFPFEIADAWFQQTAADGIDGVIFYLPQEDCVAGWDYPRRRHYLDARRIHHLLVRDDAGSISEECHERIEAFIRSINAER